MSRVVKYGTAFYSKIDSIEICGKTGTVQNPRGADHSVFVAFAPRINPKIAIAVVVENAGYGATWSAPIASLLIEKYLTDTISRPKYYIDRLLEANLLPIKPIVLTKPIVKDTVKGKQKIDSINKIIKSQIPKKTLSTTPKSNSLTIPITPTKTVKKPADTLKKTIKLAKPKATLPTKEKDTVNNSNTLQNLKKKP